MSKKLKVQLHQTTERKGLLWLRALWRLILAHKLQIAVALVALIVLGLRRTDAVLNPQLFAEDGKDWMQHALDSDYSPVTLFSPYAGYLVVFQRLVALISGLFPIEITPAVFVFSALLVQVLPLVYLWSKRVESISTKWRVFLTLFYLCIPFSDEIHANLTNSQWYLALALFILVFIKESANSFTKWVERVIVLVASLSGPFSILLTPILAFDAWRSKRVPIMYRLVFLGAVLQLMFILATFSERTHQNIGFSITHLLQIIGGQIFGAGLFGAESLQFFMSKPWIAPLTAILGIELLIYVFVKSSRVLKYFLTFAFIVFVATLVSPVGVPPNVSWWEVLLVEGVGGRYYFLIHIAVYISLGWLIFSRRNKNLYLRLTAICIALMSLVIGVPKDFTHKPYPDLNYDGYVRQFEQLPEGDSLTVPINPGLPWHVELKK